MVLQIWLPCHKLGSQTIDLVVKPQIWLPSISLAAMPQIGLPNHRFGHNVKDCYVKDLAGASDLAGLQKAKEIN